MEARREAEARLDAGLVEVSFGKQKTVTASAPVRRDDPILLFKEVRRMLHAMPCHTISFHVGISKQQDNTSASGISKPI